MFCDVGILSVISELLRYLLALLTSRSPLLRCLNSISVNLCPLCRSHFNKNSTVRLRVELIRGDLIDEELRTRHL